MVKEIALPGEGELASSPALPSPHGIGESVVRGKAQKGVQMVGHDDNEMRPPFAFRVVKSDGVQKPGYDGKQRVSRAALSADGDEEDFPRDIHRPRKLVGKSLAARIWHSGRIENGAKNALSFSWNEEGKCSANKRNLVVHAEPARGGVVGAALRSRLTVEWRTRQVPMPLLAGASGHFFPQFHREALPNPPYLSAVQPCPSGNKSSSRDLLSPSPSGQIIPQ